MLQTQLFPIRVSTMCLGEPVNVICDIQGNALVMLKRDLPKAQAKEIVKMANFGARIIEAYKGGHVPAILKTIEKQIFKPNPT